MTSKGSFEIKVPLILEFSLGGTTFETDILLDHY